MSPDDLKESIPEIEPDDANEPLETVEGEPVYDETDPDDA